MVRAWRRTVPRPENDHRAKQVGRRLDRAETQSRENKAPATRSGRLPQQSRNAPEAASGTGYRGRPAKRPDSCHVPETGIAAGSMYACEQGPRDPRTQYKCTTNTTTPTGGSACGSWKLEDPAVISISVQELMAGELAVRGVIEVCVRLCGRGVRTVSAGLARLKRGRSAEKGADEAGDTVRHYTTAERAKQIERSGEFRPNAKGELFFTPDEYESASAAQTWLALPTKPNAYFEVPVSRIPGGLPGATRVGPNFGQPGGGLECVVQCSVSARGLRARRIGE